MKNALRTRNQFRHGRSGAFSCSHHVNTKELPEDTTRNFICSAPSATRAVGHTSIPASQLPHCCLSPAAPHPGTICLAKLGTNRLQLLVCTLCKSEAAFSAPWRLWPLLREIVINANRAKWSFNICFSSASATSREED